MRSSRAFLPFAAPTTRPPARLVDARVYMTSHTRTHRSNRSNWRPRWPKRRATRVRCGAKRRRALRASSPVSPASRPLTNGGPHASAVNELPRARIQRAKPQTTSDGRRATPCCARRFARRHVAAVPGVQ